jgi:DNA-binding PadR family transcriptional regulator
VEAFLQAFDENTELHGWAITKAVKRSGPTVYGVLDRLEDAAWITGRWEVRHLEPNKPRRRFYRLTPTGVAAVRALLAERRPEVWNPLPRPAPGVVVINWLHALLPGGAR